jgi:hypothetical protein
MSTLVARLNSRKVRAWLPWVSGLVLVAGVVAFAIAYFGNTGTSLETPLSNKPARVTNQPKSVPVPPGVKKVAGKFILGAVLRYTLPPAERRAKLASVYNLAGPEIRTGQTLRQWQTGDIAVVPFTKKVDIAPMKVDYSYRNEVLLEVMLLPKQGKGQDFFVRLNKVGSGKQARWVVNAWTPRNSTFVPNAGTE